MGILSAIGSIVSFMGKAVDLVTNFFIKKEAREVQANIDKVDVLKQTVKTQEATIQEAKDAANIDDRVRDMSDDELDAELRFSDASVHHG